MPFIFVIARIIYFKGWKSCVGLKPTGGSNPLLCAIEITGCGESAATLLLSSFLYWNTSKTVFTFLMHNPFKR